MKEQDYKIHDLKQLTSRYESEIYSLKSKNHVDSDKFDLFKHESSNPNILNTTDQSTHDSPFTDNSGFQTSKETKIKQKFANHQNLGVNSTKAQEKKYVDHLFPEHKKKVNQAIMIFLMVLDKRQKVEPTLKYKISKKFWSFRNCNLFM